jgi:transposase
MLKKNSKKIWPNVKSIIPDGFSFDKVDIWFADESRIGQKGTLTRIWAKRGQRPRVVRQQQYLNSYIIGSVCPNQKSAEAIVSPYCNSDAMHHHLEQISRATKPGHFAVVVMDRAGWHTTDAIYDMTNVAPLFLPPASPELNPMEQVWKWIKDHFLSNRIFDDYEDIEESSCDAWNIFASSKSLFDSMCYPDWAKVPV